MKKIVIGDIHGREGWKEQIKDPQIDLVYITGDYFDSFDIPYPLQFERNKELFEFASNNPDRLKLCWGNHDYHYLRGIRDSYSGYQRHHRVDICELFEDNLNLFKVCYFDEGYLISHAGFSQDWVDEFEFTTLEEINSRDIHHWCFSFNEKGFNIYGDDFCQGPLWIRHRSLIKGFWEKYPYQVVGHTQTPEIVRYNWEGGSIVSVDTAGKECFELVS